MNGLPESRAPTDRQLAEIVRYLARVCLETERGLRPPAQLATYMDPAEALRLQHLLTLGRFQGGPLQPKDVGPAHLTHNRDGTVFATVVTRTEGQRWGALSLRLRERDGHWQIADIHRLLAATRSQPARDRMTPEREAASRSRSR